MPIYEFHCESCGKDAELLVRSSSWKGEKCPACGSTRLVKKLSVFAASHGESSGPGCESFPSCAGNPSSCGCCGGGPHHH